MQRYNLSGWALFVVWVSGRGLGLNVLDVWSLWAVGVRDELLVTAKPLGSDRLYLEVHGWL